MILVNFNILKVTKIKFIIIIIILYIITNNSI